MSNNSASHQNSTAIQDKATVTIAGDMVNGDKNSNQNSLTYIVIAAIVFGFFALIVALYGIERDHGTTPPAPTNPISNASMPPTAQNTITPPTTAPVPTTRPTAAIDSTTAFFLNQANANSFTDSYALGKTTMEPAPDANKPLAKKITFTHSGTESFCGWNVQLQNLNVSQKNALSFWVRGKDGGEKFEIGLKDRKTFSGSEPKVVVEVSTEWKQVIIPLDAFTNSAQPELNRLENLSIASHTTLGDATIFVDAFTFEP